MKRVIAVILSLLMTNQVVFGTMPEQSVWEQRRNSANKNRELFAQLPLTPNFSAFSNSSVKPLPKISPTIIGGDRHLSGVVAALSGQGVVQDIRLSNDVRRNPIIVYLQDVHGQMPAQQSISSMILSLLEIDPSAVVGLEGAAGRIDMAAFRGPDVNVNREAASLFLNGGLIAGPETALMSAPQTPNAVGLETADLYLQNVAAVRASLRAQDRMKTAAARLSEKAAAEKRAAYSPDLLALDAKLAAWTDGSAPMGETLSFAASRPQSPSMSGYSEMKKFLDVWEIEKSLNFNQTEKERGQFIAELTKKAAPADLKMLMDQTVALKADQIGITDYHKFLKALATKKGVRWALYPNFDKYIAYVLQADAIKGEKLLTEVDSYTETLWANAVQTPAQQRAYAAGQVASLVSKLVTLGMTTQEWSKYNEAAASSDFLAKNFNAADLKPFESFYEAAEARNESLASNLLSAIPASSSNVQPLAVVVAGGFHGEGLRKLLAENNATVVTVAPKLVSVEDGSDPYLSIFTRDPLPLDRIYESQKISLVESPRVSNLDKPDQTSSFKTILPPILLALGSLIGGTASAAEKPLPGYTNGGLVVKNGDTATVELKPSADSDALPFNVSAAKAPAKATGEWFTEDELYSVGVTVGKPSAVSQARRWITAGLKWLFTTRNGLLLLISSGIVTLSVLGVIPQSAAMMAAVPAIGIRTIKMPEIVKPINALDGSEVFTILIGSGKKYKGLSVHGGDLYEFHGTPEEYELLSALAGTKDAVLVGDAKKYFANIKKRITAFEKGDRTQESMPFAARAIVRLLTANKTVKITDDYMPQDLDAAGKNLQEFKAAYYANDQLDKQKVKRDLAKRVPAKMREEGPKWLFNAVYGAPSGVPSIDNSTPLNGKKPTKDYASTLAGQKGALTVLEEMMPLVSVEKKSGTESSVKKSPEFALNSLETFKGELLKGEILPAELSKEFAPIDPKTPLENLNFTGSTAVLLTRLTGRKTASGLVNYLKIEANFQKFVRDYLKESTAEKVRAVLLSVQRKLLVRGGIDYLFLAPYSISDEATIDTLLKNESIANPMAKAHPRFNVARWQDENFSRLVGVKGLGRTLVAEVYAAYFLVGRRIGVKEAAAEKPAAKPQPAPKPVAPAVESRKPKAEESKKPAAAAKAAEPVFVTPEELGKAFTGGKPYVAALIGRYDALLVSLPESEVARYTQLIQQLNGIHGGLDTTSVSVTPSEAKAEITNEALGRAMSDKALAASIVARLQARLNAPKLTVDQRSKLEKELAALKNLQSLSAGGSIFQFRSWRMFWSLVIELPAALSVGFLALTNGQSPYVAAAVAGLAFYLAHIIVWGLGYKDWSAATNQDVLELSAGVAVVGLAVFALGLPHPVSIVAILLHTWRHAAINVEADLVISGKSESVLLDWLSYFDSGKFRRVLVAIPFVVVALLSGSPEAGSLAAAAPVTPEQEVRKTFAGDFDRKYPGANWHVLSVFKVFWTLEDFNSYVSFLNGRKTVGQMVDIFVAIGNRRKEFINTQRSLRTLPSAARLIVNAALLKVKGFDANAVYEKDPILADLKAFAKKYIDMETGKILLPQLQQDLQARIPEEWSTEPDNKKNKDDKDPLKKRLLGTIAYKSIFRTDVEIESNPIEALQQTIIAEQPNFVAAKPAEPAPKTEAKPVAAAPEKAAPAVAIPQQELQERVLAYTEKPTTKNDGLALIALLREKIKQEPNKEKSIKRVIASIESVIRSSFGGSVFRNRGWRLYGAVPVEVPAALAAAVFAAPYIFTNVDAYSIAALAAGIFHGVHVLVGAVLYRDVKTSLTDASLWLLTVGVFAVGFVGANHGFTSPEFLFAILAHSLVHFGINYEVDTRVDRALAEGMRNDFFAQDKGEQNMAQKLRGYKLTETLNPFSLMRALRRNSKSVRQTFKDADNDLAIYDVEALFLGAGTERTILLDQLAVRVKSVEKGRGDVLLYSTEPGDIRRAIAEALKETGKVTDAEINNYLNGSSYLYSPNAPEPEWATQKAKELTRRTEGFVRTRILSATAGRWDLSKYDLSKPDAQREWQLLQLLSNMAVADVAGTLMDMIGSYAAAQNKA